MEFGLLNKIYDAVTNQQPSVGITPSGFKMGISTVKNSAWSSIVDVTGKGKLHAIWLGAVPITTSVPELTEYGLRVEVDGERIYDVYKEPSTTAYADSVYTLGFITSALVSSGSRATPSTGAFEGSIVLPFSIDSLPVPVYSFARFNVLDGDAAGTPTSTSSYKLPNTERIKVGSVYPKSSPKVYEVGRTDGNAVVCISAIIPEPIIFKKSLKITVKRVPYERDSCFRYIYTLE